MHSVWTLWSHFSEINTINLYVLPEIFHDYASNWCMYSLPSFLLYINGPILQGFLFLFPAVCLFFFFFFLNTSLAPFHICACRSNRKEFWVDGNGDRSSRLELGVTDCLYCLGVNSFTPLSREVEKNNIPNMNDWNVLL